MALANETEDIPGMSFLNSAFDSSTIMNTNINCMKKFSPIAYSKVAASTSGLLKCPEAFSNSITNIATNNTTPTVQRKIAYQSRKR